MWLMGASFVLIMCATAYSYWFTQTDAGRKIATVQLAWSIGRPPTKASPQSAFTYDFTDLTEAITSRFA
jgi:hypothetical protein